MPFFLPRFLDLSNNQTVQTNYIQRVTNNCDSSDPHVWLSVNKLRDPVISFNSKEACQRYHAALLKNLRTAKLPKDGIK
jgi:hypothetical protein